MSSSPARVALSADMLHRLIADSPDGMLVVDRRGIVVFANPAAVRMLRTEGHALVGSAFGRPAVTPDTTELHVPETGAVLAMRTVRTDWAGRPARLVTLHDVARRPAAAGPEAAWSAAAWSGAAGSGAGGSGAGGSGAGGPGVVGAEGPDAVLPVADHMVGLGSFEIDVPTGRVTRSPGYARIVGRSIAELASHPQLLTEAVHPDDRDRFLESNDAALAGERPLDIEFRFVRPHGEARLVHAIGELLLGEDGRPATLRGAIRDITDERHAIEALSTSEQRFRLLAEYSQDVVFLVRLVPERKVEYISPAAEAVLGYPRDELTGDLDRVLAVLRPDGGDLTEGLRSASEQEREPEPCVYPGRKGDGSTAWFERRMVAVRDENGRVVAVEGQLRDVTDRVTAEREQRRLAHQLEQAERLEALGRLAGGVAHDFNNLLAVILGTAELLADDMDPGDARRADVERITHAAERGAALTGQLLIFSRREPTRPEIIDLNQVVTRLENMLRRTIGEDIEFGSRLAPGLAAVSIDRAKLEQVVLNLVVNARAAMPEGGRLTLETSDVLIQDADPPLSPAGAPAVPPGAYVRLIVADTGCGMSPEVARRAFEPFFTTRARGEGSGLGLATVHGVVKGAGGHITLDTRPGTGTTFQVDLPAVDARADSPVAEVVDAPMGRGEIVLVVEDEDPVREVVTRVLSRNGYGVLTARDATAAIRLCADREVGIDLLLTDLIMPGMTGGRLAERLRATCRPGLPVVFMSGYAAGQQPRDPALDRSASILHKPFDAETLLHRVRAALEGRGPAAG